MHPTDQGGDAVGTALIWFMTCFRGAGLIYHFVSGGGETPPIRTLLFHRTAIMDPGCIPDPAFTADGT
jgi:hypothetical protein